MTNASSSENILEKLDYYDYVRCGAIFVGFAVSVTNQKNWVRAVNIVCIVASIVSIVVPSQILQNQVSWTPTPLQRCLSHMLACSMLAQSLCTWRTWRNSRDDTVPAALLWSTLLRVSLVLVASMYYMAKFRQEHVYFFMFTLGLGWLGCAYHVFTCRNPVSGRVKNTPMNWLLRADFIILLVAAVVHYGCPDMVIDLWGFPTGPLNYFLIRCCGADFFANAMFSLAAVAFRHNDDQGEVFISRILSSVLMMIMMLYDGGTLPTFGLEITRLVGFFVCNLPAAIGILVASREERLSDSETENLHFTRSKGKVN